MLGRVLVVINEFGEVIASGSISRHIRLDSRLRRNTSSSPDCQPKSELIPSHLWFKRLGYVRNSNFDCFEKKNKQNRRLLENLLGADRSVRRGTGRGKCAGRAGPVGVRWMMHLWPGPDETDGFLSRRWTLLLAGQQQHKGDRCCRLATALRRADQSNASSHAGCPAGITRAAVSIRNNPECRITQQQQQ